MIVRRIRLLHIFDLTNIN